MSDDERVKLYSFDMDGTLVESYMERADRDFSIVTLLPGVAARIAELRAAGHRIAVITNQGGVAFGYTSEQDVIHKLAAVATALSFPSIWIHDGGLPVRAGWTAPTLDCFVCYNDSRSKTPEYQDVARRKPSGAMIVEAMQEADARAEDTTYVGDRPEDEAAARAAGVAFVWAQEFFR